MFPQPWAERRAGEILGDMEKAKPSGANQYEDRSHDVTDPPTLADLGLSKMQSSRWQTIAAMPEDAFEAHIAKTKARNEELTTASVLRLAKDLVREEARQEMADRGAQEVAAPASTVSRPRRPTGPRQRTADTAPPKITPASGRVSPPLSAKTLNARPRIAHNRMSPAPEPTIACPMARRLGWSLPMMPSFGLWCLEASIARFGRARGHRNPQKSTGFCSVGVLTPAAAPAIMKA